MGLGRFTKGFELLVKGAPLAQQTRPEQHLHQHAQSRAGAAGTGPSIQGVTAAPPQQSSLLACWFCFSDTQETSFSFVSWKASLDPAVPHSPFHHPSQVDLASPALPGGRQRKGSPWKIKLRIHPGKTLCKEMCSSLTTVVVM